MDDFFGVNGNAVAALMGVGSIAGGSWLILCVRSRGEF